MIARNLRHQKQKFSYKICHTDPPIKKKKKKSENSRSSKQQIILIFQGNFSINLQTENITNEKKILKAYGRDENEKLIQHFFLAVSVTSIS